MIAGIFHEGSGLGDQLFRYITVRTLAEKKGYEWGMINPSDFKGCDFVDLNLGTNPSTLDYSVQYESDRSSFGPLKKVWKEKNTIERYEKDGRYEDIDIRSYDPEINFVEDNTIIDGSFEDDKYWGHNLHNINKWLRVEPLEVSDDLCVIGFRGGEYTAFPDLFLPKEYYEGAMAKMLEINPNMKFEVHTDDPVLASRIFVGIPIVENSPISHSKHTNMGFNWRSVRYAKYAIIPNSSFYILPRLLAHKDWLGGGAHGPPVYGNKVGVVTIAPRYWARHNTRTWARPACYYKEFTYIHAEDTH